MEYYARQQVIYMGELHYISGGVGSRYLIIRRVDNNTPQIVPADSVSPYIGSNKQSKYLLERLEE